MLHSKVIRPLTLDVLKILMSEPLLNNFVLVGGTGLSLHFGHRLSEDIDMFSFSPFDIDVVIRKLSDYLPISVKLKTPIGVHLFIKNVKTDLIYYPVKLMKPVIESEGIRLASVEDIA